jgi:transcriptional regulator with XRE-family HTH domain
MNTQPQSPNTIVGRQLRELRESRRMTQQQLVDKLSEMGVDPKPARATIARTELGERNIGLDEAFALAAALDVSPARLMLPAHEAVRVAITPNLDVSARDARMWLRGSKALPGQDGRTFLTDVSDEEWIVLQNNTIQFMTMRMQEMIDAALAKDEDKLARLREAVNDELTRRAEWEGRP